MSHDTEKRLATEYVTLKEAGELCGVNTATIRSQIYMGRIRAKKEPRTKGQRGGEAWYITRGELHRYLANRPRTISSRPVKRTYVKPEFATHLDRNTVRAD